MIQSFQKAFDLYNPEIWALGQHFSNPLTWPQNHLGKNKFNILFGDGTLNYRKK